MVLFAIIEAPRNGWTDPVTVVCFLVGAAVLAAFAWWELHSAHPMLDIRFFKNPRFSAASATITLTYFALFGSTFLLTQYFQFVQGYSPLKAGLMTAPVAVGLMIGGPLAPRLVHRFGTKLVVAAGLSIVALCLLAYASDTLIGSVAIGMAIRLCFGFGMGLTTAPATESIMGSLPPGKAGVGSAVNDTTRQTGGALGVAVIGTIFALRYHAVVQPQAAAIPGPVRADVIDSIGKALDAARGLPAGSRTAVEQLVRGAYITSMRVAFGMAAGIVLVAAFIAWRFLPARAPADDLVILDEEVDVAAALGMTDA